MVQSLTFIDLRHEENVGVVPLIHVFCPLCLQGISTNKWQVIYGKILRFSLISKFHFHELAIFWLFFWCQSSINDVHTPVCTSFTGYQRMYGSTANRYDPLLQFYCNIWKVLKLKLSYSATAFYAVKREEDGF